MSDDEVRRELQAMTDSGRLSPATARVAIANPVEGEKIARLGRIEKKQDRQELALFGDKHLDPPGDNPGLIKDVRGLKFVIFRATWAICGVVGFCTFLLTLLGFYIEYSKH